MLILQRLVNSRKRNKIKLSLMI